MLLPIPTILENAGNVLDLAKKITQENPAVHDRADNIQALKDALKKVSPEDLLAVMNEVGKLYAGVHNIQVQQIGVRKSEKTRGIEIALQIEFGIGPRTLIVPLPPEAASAFLENMKAEMSPMGSGKIITNPGEIIGG